jgi:hypothetical protein
MTPNVIRQNEVNALMTKLGVFWAFSNEQFDTNKTPLKEGEKYVSIGAGGYMPKSNVDAYMSGMKDITKDFKDAMKDIKARKAHVAYELNNHEACYTRDISSTLDALGEEFTREEVLSVYDGRKAIK